jgi:hypothetical protein
MTVQAVTLRLPDMLYRRLEQRAREKRRSVEDELVSVVSSALPTIDDLSADIAGDMAQLTFLTDAELWQAAHSQLPERDAERMQALLWKRQREGLSAAETREVTRLGHRANHTMLVRARAAVLLKERGYDISELRTAELG